MTRKRMSWAQAVATLLVMTAFEVGLTLAFLPAMRQQVRSARSLFWQVGIPSDFVANAILVLMIRFAYNRLLICPNGVKRQGHQSSRVRIAKAG